MRSLRGVSSRTSALLQELPDEAGDVGVQPRDAGELNRVGDLVQRHPGHELVLLGAERLHRLAEVREHEQQARRPVLDRLVEQHQLVLAEHALGQVADDHPDLGAQDDAHPDLDRRLERPEVVARALEHRVEQQRIESMLLATHSWRLMPSGGGSGRAGCKAGVGDDAGLCLGRPARPGRPSAWRASPVPATNVAIRLAMIQSITPGSSRVWLSVSVERAAITGEVGSAVSGALSGSSHQGKLTTAARLAHDQLAGGGVDAARAPQRHHPVEPRAAATWHSDAAIVPSARRR